MENATKAMFLGFAVIIFVSAVAITVAMYARVTVFREAMGQHYYYSNVMAGE